MKVKVEYIWDRINEPGSALQLGVFRAAVGAQVWYASNTKAFEYFRTVNGFQGTVTWFPGIVDDWIALMAVPWLQGGLQIAAVLVALGLWTRICLPIATVLFVLLYSYYYRCANAPVQWLYLWFPMIVLCFSRCGDDFSIDALVRRNKSQFEGNEERHYQWSLELVVGWFAYIYFAAGLAKLFPISKFAAWIEGGTSKNIIYSRFLDSPLYFIFDRPLFNYADGYWVYPVLTMGSVVIELATVSLLVSRTFYLPVVVAIMTMHMSLYFVGVVGFAQTALVLSIALLPARIFSRPSRDQTVFPA